MQKTSEKRRRSIYKVFNTQESTEASIHSSQLVNQKLQVIVRLIADDNPSQQTQCLFRLDSRELEIIKPDDSKLFQEINGFEKRELLRHSPQSSQSDNNLLTIKSNEKEQVNLKTEQNDQKIKNNVTPEKKQEYKGWISGRLFEEGRREARFKFDHIFGDTTNDDMLFNQVGSLYTNCLRQKHNLILVNLNRPFLLTQLQFFISGLEQLKQIEINRSNFTPQAEIYLHCFELTHPSNKKHNLLEPLSISRQSAQQVQQTIKARMNTLIEGSVKCCWFNFQFFDQGKLISELLVMDIAFESFLKNSMSFKNVIEDNFFCSELHRLLTFEAGGINENNFFHATLLQHFRIGDEMIVSANLHTSQSHIAKNCSLLRFTSNIYAKKYLLDNMYIQLCILQNDKQNREKQSQLLDNIKNIHQDDQKSSTFGLKEQIKVLLADLAVQEQEILRLQEVNSNLERRLRESAISSTETVMNGLQKRQCPTTISKNFGMLQNFDRSMLCESKNKSFMNQSRLINNNEQKYTQTDSLVPSKEDLNNNHLMSLYQEEQLDQIKNINRISGENESDYWNGLNEIEVTPNRYMQHLDDILSNLDSKRSASYFSPRNLSLANLALFENETFKQKLVIKDQEIEKLVKQVQIMLLQREQSRVAFVQQEYQSIQTLDIVENLTLMFENKLLDTQELLKQVSDFYEEEIAQNIFIMQFTFRAFIQELHALSADIETAKIEKQQWVQIFTHKTEDIYRQMNNKLAQKNERIKQYEEVLQKFGSLNILK